MFSVKSIRNRHLSRFSLRVRDLEHQSPRERSRFRRFAASSSSCEALVQMNF